MKITHANAVDHKTGKIEIDITIERKILFLFKRKHTFCLILAAPIRD